MFLTVIVEAGRVLVKFRPRISLPLRTWKFVVYSLELTPSIFIYILSRMLTSKNMAQGKLSGSLIKVSEEFSKVISMDSEENGSKYSSVVSFKKKG